MAANGSASELPKVRRIRYAPIMKKLMEDRDKEGALQMIKDMSGSSHPFHIANFMKHVRERISKDPRYLNPKCVHQVMELMKDTSISKGDFQKLASVLESPRRLRWIQVRKGCLDSLELHSKIADIKVFDEMYYEFMPDKDTAHGCSLYREELVKANHRHKHKNVERYNYTSQDVSAMVQQAAEFCQREDLEWKNRKNSLQLLEALSLLTGRRKNELVYSLKMRSSPVSDYQAVVSGISKDIKSGEEERVIPLLSPISVVAAGIVKLRQYAHKPADYYQAKKSKLFPELTHTMFRDLYCELAWENRHVNMFMPEQHCSKLYWCSQALCDTMSTYAMHYATAVIHHGEPDYGHYQRLLQHGQPETSVADSPGGSPQLVRQSAV